ncbi:hypothetical protein K8T06_12515, partial [bacterium]|nr:hypothetical protein [bacterium]
MDWENEIQDVILRPYITPTETATITPTCTPTSFPTNTAIPTDTPTNIPTPEPTDTPSGTPYANLIINPNPVTYPRTMSENGWITFTVVLDTQPSTDVVFDVNSSDTWEAEVSPIILIFTNSNWDDPQTVTVTGINDGTTGNDTVDIVISVDPAMSDDDFDTMVDTVLTITLEDNDDSSGGPDPVSVLILYNANWTHDSDKDGIQDSLQTTLYYSDKRGVPSTNLLGLNMPSGNRYYISTTEAVTNWSTVFFPDVMQPIIDKLNELGEDNIDVFLLSYGMPMQIPNVSGSSMCFDNYLMRFGYKSAYGTESNNVSSGYNSPGFHENPTFSLDKDRFDHSIYQDFMSTNVYLVTRLDGPGGNNKIYGSLHRSIEIVDQCLYADKYLTPQTGANQFTGTGYVDTRLSRYSDADLAEHSQVHIGLYWAYADCDVNIGWCERYLDESGFDFKWENTSSSKRIGEIGALWADNTTALNAPDALWYAGWYNYSNYIDAYDWIPGSLGSDLNSNSLSASQIRSTTGGNTWGTSALYRGISCVAGVIGEPYTNGSPHSHVFLYYLLLRGYTYAETSLLSSYHIGGWKQIYIGDPLYQPMKSGKDLNIQDNAAPVLAEGYPYVMSGADDDDWVVVVMADDSVDPEVFRVEVEYGPFDTYGFSANMTKQGYYRRNFVTLPDLIPDRAYHYRLIMTDPVGNQTITGDYCFSTSKTAPDIISVSGINAVVGELYQYQAIALGSPKPLWRLTQAPEGMTVDHVTGLVSWMPSATGNYDATLVADNDVVPNDTQNWSIVVTTPSSPGVISFSESSYEVNENSGSVMVTITRTFGTSGLVQIDYTTIDGSAETPGDYNAESGTITFANGDDADKMFFVTIHDDSIAEGCEIVNLQLSNPVNGVVIGAGASILLINDNDQTNEAPVVDAGDLLSVNWPSPADLDGTVFDDGLPVPPGSLTITWSQFSGPGIVSFNDPSDIDTTATFSIEGTYVLRLTADDSEYSYYDDVTITVNPQDVTPPAIDSVSAEFYCDKVVVVYSENIEEASAENTSNYTLTGGITISNAALEPDLRMVILTVGAMTADTEYTLTVNNVRDRAWTPNTIPPDTQMDFRFNPYLCVADFGGEEIWNEFKLEGWNELDKPYDLRYTYDGPDGVLCQNHGYKSLKGTGYPFDFISGDKVVVLWYNSYSSAITFTPRISFDDPDGEYFDDYHQFTGGSWNNMSELTLDPGT